MNCDIYVSKMYFNLFPFYAIVIVKASDSEYVLTN